jgi:hypothetical protein
MNSECSVNQQRIPRSFVGDLALEERQALENHLAECLPCRSEHARYGETLNLLRAAGDEPVPRHFFVYPKASAVSPWQLFRQMMPRWQAATACAAGLLLMIGIAAASSLQIRKDSQSWQVSFGGSGASSALDVAALKADILRLAEERNRELASGYIQILRTEISESHMDLSQQQQIQLAAAFNVLESRLGNRIDDTARDIRAGNQKTAQDLYQAVSQQQAQDLNAVNSRIDKVIEDTETRARQTDTILETLFQIANLNLRQPGEQR